MGWLIAITIVVMTAGYLLGEHLYDRRRYPYRFTCKYCRASGTTFAFKGNQFADVRKVQLDHLDHFHAGAL